MNKPVTRAVVVAALALGAAALVGGFGLEAGAQSSPAAPGQQAAKDDAEFVQRAFTEDQLQKFIEAQDSIADIVAHVPEDKREEPDAKTQMQLDTAAQHFGFKDYGDFQEIGNTIAFILDGFDPTTKTFVGHETMIKRQIAEIQAEKTVLVAEQNAQIKELQDALKSVPPLKYPEEAPIVAKSYDKLAKIFADAP